MRRRSVALIGPLIALAITIPAAAKASANPPGGATPGAAAARPSGIGHISGIPRGRTAATPSDISNIGLYNTWTGQCADLPGYGADPVNSPVSQYYCNLTSGDNQLWNLHYTRTVNGVDLYEFINVKNGLCLDPPGYGSDPAGTHLYTYYCNANPANDNQEWWLTDVTGDADYAIVNYQDGLCLDVSGWASNNSDLAANLPLTLYPCYNSAWANGGWDDHIWDLAS